MTMIAPFDSQATFSSAHHDGCRMLQASDVKPLNVNDRATNTTIALTKNGGGEDATISKRCDMSSSIANNDTNAPPRRKGILAQCAEQREPCSPDSSEARKRKKIRFFESVQCLLVVPSRNEYTKDEMRQLWYVEQEYKTIKNDIQITLKQMMKKFPASENDQMCYRGLEFRTKQGALLKTLRRENAYDAVLGEQARQDLLELHDPQLISFMYIRAAEESCREAMLRAQRDAGQCSRMLLDDKRRTTSKRKLFFGMPRDGINRTCDPSSTRTPAAIITRHND